jgi:hypothetical protein
MVDILTEQFRIGAFLAGFRLVSLSHVFSLRWFVGYTALPIVLSFILKIQELRT